MSCQNRWEPRSSSQLQGQKMLSEGRVRLTNTHTYTLYSSSFHGRLSPHISFCDPHLTVFFVAFFLPLDTTGLRGESSCRPDPLHKPLYEPSHIDIQFYYNF